MTATFTIDQNNPPSSIAKLCTYFERLDAVDVNIPELVKALILIQAIHKVWEAAASKSFHDIYHEVDPKTDQERRDAEPGRKPALILDHIQNAIMVEYEWLNSQFTGQLTAVKCGRTNTPSFQQQQHPHPPQRQQQSGQQQQTYQQRAPPSNQDKGKKKKQQQQGMCGGICHDSSYPPLTSAQTHN
ncbi:hypothetical protein PQX77_021650 [Marasmius sp. AFHP31]|nr:hypothetical protein PQX77_021650 [Marasmius sp. AFHP31]